MNQRRLSMQFGKRFSWSSCEKSVASLGVQSLRVLVLGFGYPVQRM